VEVKAKRISGFGGVFGSFWTPTGSLARLGDHAMAGVTFGFQYGDWFARSNFGFRFARAGYPYYVDYNNEWGWSDRTTGVKMTVDIGKYVIRHGRHDVGVFAGGGMDFLYPFHELEDYVISGALGLVGAEYRLWLGQNHYWNISVDAKKEWYGKWDGNGTEFSGGSWDFRLGFGYAPGNGDAYVRAAKIGRN